MGYGDIIIDNCANLLDELMLHLQYREDEIDEIIYGNDTVELVAAHIKIYEKSCYLKKDWHKLDGIDWHEKAISFIKAYYEEHYE
jgi:hypothetical protein